MKYFMLFLLIILLFLINNKNIELFENEENTEEEEEKLEIDCDEMNENMKMMYDLWKKIDDQKWWFYDEEKEIYNNWRDYLSSNNCGLSKPMPSCRI